MVLGILSRRFRNVKLYPEATNLKKHSVQELKRLIDGLTYPSNVYLTTSTVVRGCCDNPQACKCGQTTITSNSVSCPGCKKQARCSQCNKKVCTTTTACWYCLHSGCIHCDEQYQAPSVNEAPNHSNCGPIENFKAEVAKIIEKVEGLDLTRFVKNHPEHSKISIPKDLWLCLEFK